MHDACVVLLCLEWTACVKGGEANIHLSACQDTQRFQVNCLGFSQAPFNQARQLIGIFCWPARLKIWRCHGAELHIEP